MKIALTCTITQIMRICARMCICLNVVENLTWFALLAS
uniref:Uncharacterized protein n=1 Tax=Anguilla anguilla TaxID=7936 RepID=A0A0E9THB7_ANGAN